MRASERPLAGRTILLARPPERATALATRLRELGADVDTRPTIALDGPLDPEPARQCVRDLDRFAWLVFTSANGVRFFDELRRELGRTEPDDLPRVAVIGPATAREAESRGYRLELVAEESTAEGLARAFSGLVGAGESVLLVRPEVARPVLPRALEALGARVAAVAFYRNRAAPEAADVAAAVLDGRYDVVVLSSPSSLERMLESSRAERGELLRALGTIALVAIGPVTARAVEREGLVCAAVAETPTDEAVLGSVVECCRNRL